MTARRIAVYPGDGIGPEVTAQALRVLERVGEWDPAARCEFTHIPWGIDYYSQTGQVAPDNFLELLRPHDAIFLGALGWPEKLPDHVTLAPLVKLRQAFDQYACLRPAKLYPGVKSPLAGRGPEQIDFVVLRENSEGEYVDCGCRMRVGRPDEFAHQTSIHTRVGVERILRFGYSLARTRRRKLTMITKSNAMRFAYGLWDDVLTAVQGDYPDVETDKQHADAAAMNMVRCPERFDVVVASNLFGDLLTDLGGMVAGGLGLAPSTNTNPERKFPSMFEPVHGSAPDIAGQGIANPVAAILSAAMMLDWLECRRAGEAIRAAVAHTLAAGNHTPDLGGKLTTSQMGDSILTSLDQVIRQAS